MAAVENGADKPVKTQDEAEEEALLFESPVPPTHPETCLSSLFGHSAVLWNTASITCDPNVALCTNEKGTTVLFLPASHSAELHFSYLTFATLAINTAVGGQPFHSSDISR